MYKIWLIEFLQNFPLACAFVFGYAQYISDGQGAAVLVVLAGTLTGVLLIRQTEPRISGEPVERPAVTLSNFIVFSGSILLAIPYFGWQAGGWATDLLAGAAIGLITTLSQARAAGEAPSMKHAAALTTALPAAFLLLRFWALRSQPLPAAIGLAVLVTTIIVFIDYRNGR